MRLPWLNHTTDRPPPQDEPSNTISTSPADPPIPEFNRFPFSQEWRDYLVLIGQCIGLRDAPITNTTSEPARKKRKKTGPNELNALFGIDFPQDLGPVDVYWQGSIIVDAAAIQTRSFLVPDAIARQVIWDLYEHNFRLEFLALDRCIQPRELMSKEAASERDDMVANCFPQHSFTLVDLPQHDEGLGARLVETRSEWVDNFRMVMALWPGAEAARLAVMSAVRRLKTGTIDEAFPSSVEAVERIAYPFYCQMFFDYFGRAASVPRILPPRQ